MKLILLSLFMSLLALGGRSQNTVTVTVEGFGSNEGTVRVGLYNQAGDFLERAYRAHTSEISEKTATVTFKDIPDGTYAISCYHDEDNDGELDMILGLMPSEDYGCSNGARGLFGPPKWEDAKFKLSGGVGKKVAIKL